jgi:hypothetical protein
MGCMLRISGRRFDVDRYLQRSSLSPAVVYRRGEPLYPASQPKGAKNLRSGANFTVSRRDFLDFRGQVREAVRFLRRFASEARRLRRFPGLESVCLDFGVEPLDGIVVECWRFPQELIGLAKAGSIELELSVYLTSEHKPKRRRRQKR